jgi:GrpB-like predicted nucleotidyltransferase (UPF0157 family)
VNIEPIDHTTLMVKRRFHLQEWMSGAAKVAADISNKIHAATPELEVLFMGAAALKLPGKNDIDIDILCSAKDITRYTELLLPVLGKPKDTKDTITVWEFIQDGFEIDCILSDPTSSHVPAQRKVFELLEANTRLRNEYEQLKRDCDGLSYEEYEKRKKAFFARIVESY